MTTLRKISVMLTSALLILSMATVQAVTRQAQPTKTGDAVKAADADFPGRKKYPKVPYITLEQLHAEYDDVIVVDARSSYEFKTLRVASAINIPLSLNNMDFRARVEKLRDENPAKKIVFYCNGHTCMKSYKATRRAMIIAKLDNVFAFDAGIFEWTKAHPDKAVLLGESPVDTSKLISKADYKKHILPALDFIKKADENTIILDVRSIHQREGFDIFSGVEVRTSMQDKKTLKEYIDKARKENKKLFIYDAVGKQVRWLQYFLEQNDAGPYYFMQGGAMAFFDIPNKDLID